MKALLAIALVAGEATAGVHTDIGEARACLPIAGGALVGTGGGLVKLDDAGRVRAVWTASDGLPGTLIEMIAMVAGELWIGTDAGAARVTLGDRLAIVERAGDTGVRDVVRVGGATYLATRAGLRRGGALVPYAVASKRKDRLDVTALAVVDGTLYAGTAGGLYRLANGKLRAIAEPAGPIVALHADGARLLVGTPLGLHARTGASTRLLGHGDIRRIAKLDGELVVARMGEGLARLDRGRLATIAGGTTLAQTVAANAHGACAGGLDGAWLRGRTGWIRGADRAGPPSNDISALAHDGKRLWVGTFDRGLAVLEGSTWRTIAADKLDGRINAIHVEKSGRVWVATASGLYAITGNDVARFARGDGLPSRGVLALAGMRDGRLLVGTSAGAAIVGTGRPVRLAKGKDLGNVWAVGEDASGAIWLGTTTGLYRGSETTTEWQRFSLASGHLRDDWVMALAFDGAAVVAGTYHGGVARIEGTTATQLGDGWVNPAGLVLDGGRVLAATMDGLVTIGGAKQTGLPGKDVTAVVRAGGALFVATRRGLAVL
jgi:ligand-binding sensor domain-containing protein